MQVKAHEYLYEDLEQQHWRTAVTAVDSAEVRRRIQFDLPKVLLNAGTVGSEYLVSRHDYGSGPCAECLYPQRKKVPLTEYEILARQTGLDLEELAELLSTKTPLSEKQVDQIREKGSLLFSSEDLNYAKIKGLQTLIQTACTTAKIRPELPIATIGFVAAIPGILLAAELVKETLNDNTKMGRIVLSNQLNVFRQDTFGDLKPKIELSIPSRFCRCQTEVMRKAYQHLWS